MACETKTWEELLSSPAGAGRIVVSMSGALSRLRSDGFGDGRTVVTEHYEAIGNRLVIVTLNTLTGGHNGYVAFPGKDMPESGDWNRIAAYQAFDGMGIRIVADGGIRILGTAPTPTKEEAIESARALAHELDGMR